MQIQADVKILQELVSAIAGKNTEAVVGILKGKKDVNEYKIAKKLEMTINQTRNILYKLYNEGIVSFTRKKDKQKGWYIYYWTFNTVKAIERFLDIKKMEIENLKHQLASRETKRFFSCQTCHIEFTEETALHHDFICPECGQLLMLTLKEDKINEIEVAIKKAKERLALAEQELANIAKRKVKEEAREKAKKPRIKKKRKAKKVKKPRLKKKLKKTKKKKPKQKKK